MGTHSSRMLEVVACGWHFCFERYRESMRGSLVGKGQRGHYTARPARPPTLPFTLDTKPRCLLSGVLDHTNAVAMRKAIAVSRPLYGHTEVGRDEGWIGMSRCRCRCRRRWCVVDVITAEVYRMQKTLHT